MYLPLKRTGRDFWRWVGLPLWMDHSLKFLKIIKQMIKNKRTFFFLVKVDRIFPYKNFKITFGYLVNCCFFFWLLHNFILLEFIITRKEENEIYLENDNKCLAVFGSFCTCFHSTGILFDLGFNSSLFNHLYLSIYLVGFLDITTNLQNT